MQSKEEEHNEEDREKIKRKKDQFFQNFMYMVLLTIRRRLCVNYRNVRTYQRSKSECNIEIYRDIYTENINIIHREEIRENL